MGLFSFNYSKPGPGVDKDAPKKKGFFLYFEIFRRKFFKLIQANLLFFLCSIPFLILLFFISPVGGLADLAAKLVQAQPGNEMSYEEIFVTADAAFRTAFAVLVMILWGTGPASAAYAYITRCFTREEHTWLLSDGKDKFKENFKQSIIIVAIDFVILFLLRFAVLTYMNLYAESGVFIWMAMMCATMMLILIFTFMHFYIYQIMVTFECNIRTIYKNALLIAFGKAPMNLLLTVIVLVSAYFLFGYLHNIIALLITGVIYFSLVRFPIEFYSARTLQRISAEMRGGDRQ